MSHDGLRTLCQKLAAITLLAFILVSASFATSSAALAANSSSNTTRVAATAPPLVSATPHPIEYHIGCPPSMVNDGSLDYFKSKGFCTVHLIVPDQGTYQAELNKIKSMGMKAIIDIEVPIWSAGQYASTPIANYKGYFQSLKAAGWEYVSSEGGREGDVGYLIPQFFKGYVNYNCDQCGLWKDMHKQPGTVMNSWESYYPQQWPSIQQGAKEAAALGKQNGILAAVWEYGSDGKNYNPILTNSKNGGSPSYQSMLDWSYTNGCGFTHFHVWCALNSQGLSKYKALGFEQVVAQLQVNYPATSSSQDPTPTPTPTPAPITVAPAVSHQDANTLDLFTKGTDNALWWRHWTTSGWSEWTSLGGIITAEPAAVSRSAGTIDVFVRGGNGAPYQLSTTNGGSSWGSWQKLDGALAQGTGPTVAARDATTLDLFVAGTNNALYHKRWQTSGWQAWEKLGGYLTSSPAAGSRSTSTLDVFVRGGNGAPYQLSTTNGGSSWGSWQKLSGLLADGTAPAVAARDANTLDLFVTGTNRALYHASSQTSGWSATWEKLDGYLTSSPAATSRSSSTMDVFVRGTAGVLYQKPYNGGWAAWTSLGSI